MSYRLTGAIGAGVPPQSREDARATVDAVQPASEGAEGLRSLVRKAQQEDQAAQSALVALYRHRILGLVRKIIRTPSSEADVVQIVLIKMLQRLPQLRSVDLFERWVLTLARHVAVDFIRRRKRQPITVWDEAVVMSAPAPSRLATEAEVFAALEKALERLTPQDQRIVRMLVRGESYRVIAKRERISEATVKIRLHRVRPFLRQSVGVALGIETWSMKSDRNAASQVRAAPTLCHA